jgi:hypothetical protein
MIGLGPLKTLRRAAHPAPEFTQALWGRLSAAYDRAYGYERGRAPIARFVAVGISVLVLVCTLSTGVYAYESTDVVPGHVLYQVKQGMERVEGTLAWTKEDRARFHAKMMGRRMNEASHVLTIPTRVEGLLSDAAEELDMSVDELKSGLRDPSTRQEIVDELSRQNARYPTLLQRVPFLRGQGPMEGRLPSALREKLRAIMEDIESADLSENEKRMLFREELQNLLQEEREIIYGTSEKRMDVR